MIKVHNLSHHYGGRLVLRDLSFEVGAGELISVVGPNGMGKTTLLSLLGGLRTPMRGEIKINDITRRSSEESEQAIRKQVAFLPDIPWLPPERTCSEFIVAVSELYDVPAERAREHADKLLDLFALGDKADSTISSCSSGQKKKVGLAAVLASDAPVLLLDEPFSGGLDPAGILALQQVLQHAVDHHRKTVVMTTPVPEHVEQMSPKVMILRNGELFAFETLEGLRKLSGCTGSFTEVLRELVFPDTLSYINEYLEWSAR